MVLGNCIPLFDQAYQYYLVSAFISVWQVFHENIYGQKQLSNDKKLFTYQLLNLKHGNLF